MEVILGDLILILSEGYIAEAKKAVETQLSVFDLVSYLETILGSFNKKRYLKVFLSFVIFSNDEKSNP